LKKNGTQKGGMMLSATCFPDTLIMSSCGGVMAEYPSFSTVTVWRPAGRFRGLYLKGVRRPVSWPSITILAPVGFDVTGMDWHPTPKRQQNIANVAATAWGFGLMSCLLFVLRLRRLARR
jgi:hypothetical protein